MVVVRIYVACLCCKDSLIFAVYIKVVLLWLASVDGYLGGFSVLGGCSASVVQGTGFSGLLSVRLLILTTLKSFQ